MTKVTGSSYGIVGVRSISLFKSYNIYTSRAGIVATNTMFRRLHSKSTRAVYNIRSTTPSGVDFLIGDDVGDHEASMQTLLICNH